MEAGSRCGQKTAGAYRKGCENGLDVLAKVKDKRGIPRLYEVIRSSHIGIVRHRKIKGNANPFDPKYFEYFRKRRFLKTYGHGARLAESFV